jgi:hypothetical protein
MGASPAGTAVSRRGRRSYSNPRRFQVWVTVSVRQSRPMDAIAEQNKSGAFQRRTKYRSFWPSPFHYRHDQCTLYVHTWVHEF